MIIKDYNILYIDDEQSNLNSLKNLYRSKFNILTALSGKEGLKILETHPVSVVITDQRMNEMTGIEFLLKAKENFPKIKCILLTAYDDNDVVKRGINEVGLYWYLNKPFDNINLEHILVRAIESYHTENENIALGKKFEMILTTARDAIITIDSSHQIVMINPAAIEMFGFLEDELVGQNLSRLMPPNVKHHDHLINGFGNSEEVTKEMKSDNLILGKSKSGELIPIETNLSKMRIDGKIYFNAVIRDVREKKRYEKSLLESREKLKDLTQELTLAEERMKKQIAIDLHDHVGQLLFSCRMQMAAIDFNTDPMEIEKKIKSISKSLLSAIKATREVIFNLSPPQLNAIGLYAAIHDWMKVEIEEKHGLRTSISGDMGVYNIEGDTRLLLFRSIRELLLNVVKHAQANLINVVIRNSSKSLDILVRDDGIGFDFDSDNTNLSSLGFGLYSTQERISNIGGSVTIKSKQNLGTEIKLIIPMYD